VSERKYKKQNQNRKQKIRPAAGTDKRKTQSSS